MTAAPAPPASSSAPWASSAPLPPSPARTTPTVLTTDVTNGLELAVTSCAVNRVGSALNSGVWTCTSTPATVVATTPVIGNVALTNAAGVNPGHRDRPHQLRLAAESTKSGVVTC